MVKLQVRCFPHNFHEIFAEQSFCILLVNDCFWKKKSHIHVCNFFYLCKKFYLKATIFMISSAFCFCNYWFCFRRLFQMWHFLKERITQMEIFHAGEYFIHQYCVNPLRVNVNYYYGAFQSSATITTGKKDIIPSRHLLF